jgi:predicted DCC family thiol-disulfide oxidoreductase YuxK
VNTQERPVLFFDGVCNLCNRVVQIVIKSDKKDQFLFASLQSKRGAEVIDLLSKQYTKTPDSIVLFHKGKYYVRSQAVLRTALLLGGTWKLVAAAFIVPSFLRDGIYNLVARSRYKWFGKRTECMVPTPELKARFLD